MAWSASGLAGATGLPAACWGARPALGPGPLPGRSPSRTGLIPVRLRVGASPRVVLPAPLPTSLPWARPAQGRADSPVDNPEKHFCLLGRLLAPSRKQRLASLLVWRPWWRKGRGQDAATPSAAAPQRVHGGARPGQARPQSPREAKSLCPRQLQLGGSWFLSKPLDSIDFAFPTWAGNVWPLTCSVGPRVIPLHPLPNSGHSLTASQISMVLAAQSCSCLSNRWPAGELGEDASLAWDLSPPWAQPAPVCPGMDLREAWPA